MHRDLVCVCVCVGAGEPSVLIFSEVLTRANRVALKVTVPSGCSGTFMSTSLCRDHGTSSSAARLRVGDAGLAWTYLAGDAMGTQLSKTERRLNATEHGDDVDVLYTTAGRGNTTLSSRRDIGEKTKRCERNHPHVASGS